MSSKQSKERCVGDYPAVWRFTYNHKIRLGQSNGFGEVETVGWLDGQEHFDVVAVTPELAQASFQKNFGHQLKYPDDSNYAVRLVSGPEFICYVDSTVVLQ